MLRDRGVVDAASVAATVRLLATDKEIPGGADVETILPPSPRRAWARRIRALNSVPSRMANAWIYFRIEDDGAALLLFVLATPPVPLDASDPED